MSARTWGGLLLLLPVVVACRNEPGCAAEGEHARADKDGYQDCCGDLVRSEESEPTDDSDVDSTLAGLPPQCTIPADDQGQVCTQCGDGACGLGENRCNCPADCEEAAADGSGSRVRAPAW